MMDLQRSFTSVHDGEAEMAKKQLRRALLRYHDRLEAQRIVDKRDAPRRNRQRLAIVEDRVVAALCTACGWVTLFRRWPERLKKAGKAKKSGGCAKCEQGPVIRLPPVGYADGQHGLLEAVEAYAVLHRMDDAEREVLFLAFSRACKNLLIRDAVAAPDLVASKRALAITAKDRQGRREARKRSVRRVVKKLQSARHLGTSPPK
jgi:hypothetical protein